jgi:hypothetical protein
MKKSQSELEAIVVWRVSIEASEGNGLASKESKSTAG